jgi:tight adherence protein C
VTATSLLLGVAWGGVAATGCALAARRAAATARARRLSTAPTSRRTTTARLGAVLAARAPRPAARVVADLRDRRLRRRRHDALAAELPVVVDLLGVAVGAGCTPFLALGATAEWAPPKTSAALRSVLDAQARGASLDDALRDLARRDDVLRPLTDVLRDAGRLGAPLRPALARLAADHRAGLRRAAEVRARRVPVRLLFPLVFLVLPAFGLLTVAPALLAGLGAG